MAERGGPYPDELDSTLDRTAPLAAADGPVAGPSPTTRPTVADASRPRSGERTQRATAPPQRRHPTIAPTKAAVSPLSPDCRREVRVDIEPPAPAPDLRGQGARRIAGRPLTGPAPDRADEPAPDSLRELAFLDRINEVSPAQHEPPAERLPRLYDADYAILSLLDRAGMLPRVLIARAVLPDRAPSAVADRLSKLYRAGLIARHTAGLRERTRADG